MPSMIYKKRKESKSGNSKARVESVPKAREESEN